MKAARYDRKGPARDVLVGAEAERPVPASDEVLLRIRAPGINPSDTKGGGAGKIVLDV
ncbi:MAG TPA: hypothetical protein VF704_07810 [Allosphingosinicella sp.]|jgi:NADPH2:quinone reductase